MKPTPQQRAVIQHRDGHALVQAVAGSGKTGTLVQRVHDLLREEPHRTVRAVMFNRDAAAEFEERVRAECGPRARVKVQTFHSIGYALTQTLVSRGWLAPAAIETNPQWLNKAAQQALRAAKARYYGGRQTQVDADELSALLQFYDRALGDVRHGDAVRTQSDPEYFIEAVEALEAQRREQGIRGFAHLLSDPVRCLQDQPEAREGITDRIDELLVDEFQDVNGVQYELMRLLAGERARVVVCGDPDQTIYAWRGARVDFILERFAEDFPPVTRYPLTYTQRYGHEIAILATHAIRHNRLRPDSLCVSADGTPDSRVRRLTTPAGHASRAVDELKSACVTWNDAAVVCRLWSLALPFQLQCLHRGIPYRVEDSRPFIGGDATIGAARALLRVASGMFSELSRAERQAIARAFLTTPPLGLNSDALDQVARRVADQPDQAEAAILEGTRYSTVRSQHDQIATRAQLWSSFQSGRWTGTSARRVLEHFSRLTGLLSEPDHNGAGVGSRRLQAWNAVLELADGLGEGPTGLADALDAALKQEQEVRKGAPDDAIQLTTVHSAKGLQWSVVVLPGLSEGTFPCLHQGDADIEAERRLFYVGLTRAQNLALLLTPPDEKLDEYACNRRREIPRQPRASRFVYEAAPGWAIAPVARGETDELVARDPDCARRYLEAAGFRVNDPA